MRTLFLLVLGGSFFSPLPGFGETVEFIRGDVNGDGVVSLADAYRLAKFAEIGELTCGDAADVDNDGDVDNSYDSFLIISYVVMRADEPAAPFPLPGVDDGFDPKIDDRWPCLAATGDPSPDPAAKLQVIDTLAFGGSSREVAIELAVSNSIPLGGYYAEIDTAGVIEARDLDANNPEDGIVDLSGTFVPGSRVALVHSDPQMLRIAALNSIRTRTWMPPSELRPVVHIDLCVTPGTPAGDYPLTLKVGELVDYATGQRVDPTLISGVLTVLEDVRPTDCIIPPSPPPPGPSDVSYDLGDAVAMPGSEVVVPLLVHTTNSTTNGLRFSVDFDEEILLPIGIQTVLERPDGTPWPSQKYTFNTDNETPGNAGVDEGTVAGIYHYGEPSLGFQFPMGEEFVALNLIFYVNSSALVGTTEVRLLDGAEICTLLSPPQSSTYCRAVNNAIISGNMGIRVSQLGTGQVHIVAEVPGFIRGDSNDDEKVDLSDAITTLGYLFLASNTMSCLDASDVNDDGKVDISDPIFALNFLFLGGRAIPVPYPECGADESLDTLGCIEYVTCLPPS